MAYKDHPREITDEQFTEGTSIDGSRLDAAMDDVVDSFNNIPKRGMGRRFVQTQYVAGWQPWSSADRTAGEINYGQQHRMPWMPTINAPVSVPAPSPLGTLFDGTAVNISSNDQVKNWHRFKGCEIPGIYQNLENMDSLAWVLPEEVWGLQWAWSRNIHFSKPVIIRDLALHIHVDRGTATERPYQNTMLYSDIGGATLEGAPPGFAVGDSSHDLVVMIDVAHPFTPEDTNMRSVVLQSRNFGLKNSAFSQGALGVLSSTAPTYNDMSPTFRGGPDNDSQETVGGALHRMSGLNIPIPAKSRIRLAVIIPQYGPALNTDQTAGASKPYESGWGNYDVGGAPQRYRQPWSTQSYSATLTVLEEVLRGKN